MLTLRNKKATPLDRAIDRLHLDLGQYDGDSAEYAKCVKQLTKLYKIKEQSTPDRVSKDTLAIVLGNLAGVLLIVTYEKHNIVTSKALTFVQKLR